MIFRNVRRYTVSTTVTDFAARIGDGTNVVIDSPAGTTIKYLVTYNDPKEVNTWSTSDTITIDVSENKFIRTDHGSFISDGYVVDQQLTLSGSASHDQALYETPYTITAVDEKEITVSSITGVDEVAVTAQLVGNPPDEDWLTIKTTVATEQDIFDYEFAPSGVRFQLAGGTTSAPIWIKG